MTLTDEIERSRRARAAIEELIGDPAQLGPDFQPIRRLADPVLPGNDVTPDTLVGYKATGRGKPGSEVADTLSLLQGAQSLGLVERLDWAFRCLAFDVALARGLRTELHLTPEPETFGSPCPPRLAASFGRGRRELEVVAELHDDAFADERALRSALDEMRAWGWRFAVADLSDRRAVHDALSWVAPAYVHVDVSAGPAAVTPAGRAWARAALDAGAELMAVGVDRPASRDAATGLGATCGRGVLLGEPADLPA